MIHLHPQIQKALAPLQQNLAFFMQVQGQAFRSQPGRKTMRVELGGQSYFIKQHFGVGWREIFKNWLQGKMPILGAKNEWLALQRLEALGIAAPKVFAYGSQGKNPARLQSFLLMEDLQNCISLEDLCRDWSKERPGYRFKQDLLRKVAEIARVMHAEGMNHRDFYLCHFLLAKNGELHLIDLHRAGLHRHLGQRWQVKDLAGLYFSSKDCGLTFRDCLRFIKAYRRKPLRTVILEEFAFWQQVEKRGEKLYEQHR